MGCTHVTDLLAVALGEDDIDLLQTPVCGLGTEKIHGWNKECVHNGKEQVDAPCNAVDLDGGNHDDSEVEQPVRAGRDGISLGPGTDR